MRKGLESAALKRIAKHVGSKIPKQAQDLEEGYQGYRNYETWAVSLWLDNDRGEYEYWQEVIQELRGGGAGRDEYTPESVTDDDLLQRKLADRLKEHHEEMKPELEGVFGDLLNGALSEVDWREVTENLLAE